MLEQNDGEIVVSPKKIHWFCPPAVIGEEEKIDFLKIDFFIISENRKIDEINNIVKNKDEKSVFIFNLDKLFIISNIQGDKYIETVQKLVNIITENKIEKVSIVHTTIIDSKMGNLFKKIGVLYIEKSYENAKAVMENFPDIINNMFTAEGKANRAFVRINFYPKFSYKVEIKHANQETRIVQCLLKDMSMNGIALTFQDKGDIALFHLRNEVKLQLFFPGTLIKINLAIITRKDEEKIELAVNYNIKDERMITEKNANFLLNTIYKWLKNVVDKESAS